MKNRKNLFILLLGLLSAIGPLSIFMYLPGFETLPSHVTIPLFIFPC
jgi:hypothetical protein